MSNKEATMSFAERIAAAYNKPMIFSANEAILRPSRISTGLYAIDRQIGGGFPFGRMSLVAGPYSSGKSLLGFFLAKNVAKHDAVTKIRQDFLQGSFSPCRTLWFDVENVFERGWAERNGLDPNLVDICWPSTSEEAINIGVEAINRGEYGLIVLDSLAAMIAGIQQERAAEDTLMGRDAQKINELFRRWNSALATVTASKKEGPAVLCINQERDNFSMFSTGPNLPGGRAQKFVVSLFILMRKLKMDKTKGLKVGALHGVTDKNKTYAPLQEFKAAFRFQDDDNSAFGETTCAKDMVSDLKAANLLVKSKNKYTVANRTFKSQKDLVTALETELDWKSLVWDFLIAQHCNYLPTGCEGSRFSDFYVAATPALPESQAPLEVPESIDDPAQPRPPEEAQVKIQPPPSI